MLILGMLIDLFDLAGAFPGLDLFGSALSVFSLALGQKDLDGLGLDLVDVTGLIPGADLIGLTLAMYRILTMRKAGTNGPGLIS